MALTLPEGDLQSRLQRYLDGLGDRHGLEEAEIVGDVVRIVARKEDLPAVLATARETLGIPHLSFITVVDRHGLLRAYLRAHGLPRGHGEGQDEHRGR